MTGQLSEWLTREVEDLLAASSVGLYEFLWLLRGFDSDLAEVDLMTYAREALEQLLEKKAGHLVWLRWPTEAIVDAPMVDELNDEAWRNPEDGKLYLALSQG